MNHHITNASWKGGTYLRLWESVACLYFTEVGDYKISSVLKDTSSTWTACKVDVYKRKKKIYTAQQRLPEMSQESHNSQEYLWVCKTDPHPHAMTRVSENTIYRCSVNTVPTAPRGKVGEGGGWHVSDTHKLEGAEHPEAQTAVTVGISLRRL